MHGGEDLIDSKLGKRERTVGSTEKSIIDVLEPDRFSGQTPSAETHGTVLITEHSSLFVVRLGRQFWDAHSPTSGVAAGRRYAGVC